MREQWVLTENELKDEMENWINCANSFLYRGVRYFFERDPGDLKYYVGVYDTTKDEERWEFPDFDSVMRATFLDGKPFRELLPKLDWDT